MFYNFSKVVVRVILFFAFRIKAVGRENVPAEGPAILAMNHRSNFDPVMAALTCPRQLRFMAKSELFEPKVFGSLIRKRERVAGWDSAGWLLCPDVPKEKVIAVRARLVSSHL